MAAVLWLDFGVLTEPHDATSRFMVRLAPRAWADAQAKAAAGEFTGEQALSAAVADLDTPRDILAQVAREAATLAPGLLDLHGWAGWHGWYSVVVGVAPDILVESVLDDAGLDRVARHCGRMRFAYRWRLSFLSPRGIEVEQGFTVGYMAAFQRAGDLVVYVGDAPRDVEAARMAHVVFARGALLDALQGHAGRLYPFDSLDDVRSALEAHGEAWRAAFGAPRSIG